MMTWPPTLSAMKEEMRIDESDTRDDERLQRSLDAAVAYVERQRAGDFRFDQSAVLSDLPNPSSDLVLGTLRLATRWYRRINSPDGMVSLGDLGAGRVPSVDPDIERLLRIGRHAKPRVA